MTEVNFAGANNGYSESCIPSQSTSGGASSETNSSWLTFEAKEDGFFNFNLVPNQPANVDFVVYDLS
ncbi:MAG: hypothetical protein ACJAZ3_000218 [Sphingobacteriales bacterium]